jgi:hypothetical protein
MIRKLKSKRRNIFATEIRLLKLCEGQVMSLAGKLFSIRKDAIDKFVEEWIGDGP